MAQKTKKQDLSKLSFEQAINDLNGIVENIESGQTPLQASLEQYEKGMELIKHCRSILTAAEKRIEEITDSNNSDQPDEEELSPDDELF